MSLLIKTAGIMLCLASLVLGQTGPSPARSVSIDLDSEPSAPNIRSRDLKADVGRLAPDEDRHTLRVSAWGGEGVMLVDLASGHFSSSEVAEVTETRNNYPAITMTGPSGRHDFYRRVDGNLEWEITLEQAPDSNGVTYTFESDGLSFHYQPDPGDDTIDVVIDSTGREVVAGRIHRPDSVIGSYAVYHSTKRNRVRHITSDGTGLIDYGTGKAFHIYRPFAWDSSEPRRETWCELRIDTIRGELSIALPETFLQDASYPVTIDPVIGSQSAGASTWTIIQDNYRANRYKTPETITRLDSIVWWVADDAAAGDSSSAGIYDNANNLIDCAADRGVTVAGQAVKLSSGVMNGAGIDAGTYIWLPVFCEGPHQLLYDTYTIPYGGKYYFGWTPGGCADPCGGFNWDIGNDRLISIYIVYDEVVYSPRNRRRRILQGDN